MTAEQEISERLASIFMPLAAEKTAAVRKTGRRFVHYTTAENALAIIRQRRVFMRSTVCMNDYREFQHGLSYLMEFFHNPDDRKTVFEALNSISPNLAEEAIGLFDNWLPHNEFDIHVTCISEHNDWEDSFGRLSMWRAYNRPGAVGIALILNSEPFFQNSTLLQTYGSPVAYLSKEEFKSEIARVVRNIRANIDFLKELERRQLITAIYNMLLFAAASLKHPGFREEQEWRLMHLPNQNPSQALEKAVETINGVPQTVYKIPLEKLSDVDIRISTLLNKVIIGPSNFPYPLFQAFVSELKKSGVVDAEKKVVTSDIPLRTQT